jgi:hypothetical protein
MRRRRGPLHPAPTEGASTPDDMSDALTQAGFRSVEHFGPAEALDRYLRGRTDGARLHDHHRLAKATA